MKIKSIFFHISKDCVSTISEANFLRAELTVKDSIATLTPQLKKDKRLFLSIIEFPAYSLRYCNVCASFSQPRAVKHTEAFCGIL